MEHFLRLLKALFDANVEIAAAHFDPVVFGRASHRIEIRVADHEGAATVMTVARSIGLEPIELTPVEGAHYAPIVAVELD